MKSWLLSAAAIGLISCQGTSEQQSGAVAAKVLIKPRSPAAPPDAAAVAREARIRSNLKSIVSSAQMIYVQTGRYPETLEELIDPEDEEGNPYAGGLAEEPTDPWGHHYHYEIVGGEPRASCLGADHQQGGEGDDADYVYPAEDR